mmetsp:Transcript_47454/g.94940  ORF Transcript_47454/g.94940 Transcript_47454/m.94940 type:complete len:90 (+) Transcript_47454:120-389(+)
MPGQRNYRGLLKLSAAPALTNAPTKRSWSSQHSWCDCDAGCGEQGEEGSECGAVVEGGESQVVDHALEHRMPLADGPERPAGSEGGERV